ncbi:MAG: septal ring lytic transglycosylase RlpA family protein, partial [Spirochaetales bacterium]|nr:septal ring lytic transglycosylase RlpA family protein [Spirochaetales bacterium]
SLLPESGLASWYGPMFQGKPTASGEIFDTNQLTAAHKTLPFGTHVKVINIQNGKSVTVRINDRGPFIDGRIIDLSRAAAEALDMLSDGVIQVRLEILEAGATQGKPDAGPEKSSESGKATVTLQVSSFRNPEYARELRKKLSREGFQADLEFPPTGHTRVVVRAIATAQLPLVLEKLKRLGIHDVLIRSR